MQEHIYEYWVKRNSVWMYSRSWHPVNTAPGCQVMVMSCEYDGGDGHDITIVRVPVLLFDSWQTLSDSVWPLPVWSLPYCPHLLVSGIHHFLSRSHTASHYIGCILRFICQARIPSKRQVMFFVFVFAFYLCFTRIMRRRNKWCYQSELPLLLVLQCSEHRHKWSK